ncbi:MAG: D-tyrosyl-tRNA(Tyr) deacylase [Burkholderiales bacterium]|nr:D-tyrosyl-tRNA(Tyr) deacylase [Burkholderiales bacterium]MCA3215550.1 D-tyrosyl-tRNA(Tyr) deacylase [Burkholderiales bacterium]MCA3224827.1 D-tyrosyl-tRNA(Tyr) deacylase [Burkholderiales bacterium]MCE2644923.1 D-aminoacyl-tRNA deacylase [Burkholderiaceae bacterium]
MIALIQRVSRARVTVDGELSGAIGAGILALVCAECGDTDAQADRLLTKLLAYRVFGDEAGRMNRSLADVGGGLLIVSQFTLAADTGSGTRPSFSPAAAPAVGRALYERFVAQARLRHAEVATGRFGAMMQVELVNDGPVTFWLRSKPAEAHA